MWSSRGGTGGADTAGMGGVGEIEGIAVMAVLIVVWMCVCRWTLPRRCRCKDDASLLVTARGCLGHDVSQVSDEEKAKVSEEVKQVHSLRKCFMWLPCVLLQLLTLKS